MFAVGRVARSKAVGLLAAQSARVAASTLHTTTKSMISMSVRSQSTQATPEAAPATETATSKQTSKPEYREDVAAEKATEILTTQLAAGASTKELVESLVEQLDSLGRIGSRVRLCRNVLIEIMKRSAKEINDPAQTQLIPTPQDILNKTITYQAAPQAAFPYVARWLMREGHSEDVLPLWVSFLEYKSESRSVNTDAESNMQRIALLAYIETSGAAAEKKMIETLLQTKIPAVRFIQGELKRVFQQENGRSKKLRKAIENFYLKTRDPNSVQSLTEAFGHAQSGRSQPVRYALYTTRKIAEASGEPLKEETLIAFMKMLNVLNDSNESMKLWNELVSAGVAPSTPAWNALLLTVSKIGPAPKRLGQVEAIRQKIPSPDTETDAVLIQIYGRAKQLERVEEIAKGKLESSPLIAQSYVQALANTGSHAKLQECLASLKEKGIKLSTETYNSILSLLSRSKKYDEVHAMLNEMTSQGISPDVATYTILIDLTIKSLRARGQMPTDETFQLFFQELSQQGIEPNEYTLTAIMDGLFKSGAIATAQSLFKHLQSAGRASVVTYTSIITSEFENRRVREAEAHFREFLSEGYQIRPQHWAALFEGLARNGESAKCLDYLNLLEQAGQTRTMLSKYSYYFILKAARDSKDAMLADTVFEIVVKNKAQNTLTPTTLKVVGDLKQQGVAIPESIEVLLSL